MEMKVLILQSDDKTLQTLYEQYASCSVAAADRDLPFASKVDSLEKLHAFAQQIEVRIHQLFQSGSVEPACYSAAQWDDIQEPALKSSLLNGLYGPHELKELMDKHEAAIPSELESLFQSLVRNEASEHFILIWNTGELEAGAILSINRIRSDQ
ncbi:hypothetical protein EDM52_04205 [Brevibacillus invocatus]|uniref:Uncharacterized protein n=1 Tax=Brevibacillus invocatus TaxID=173959 RepID=A0A3M8CKA0_9BACL|nr:hypothetical protein EDM52_04205 [Brevibacillus invocatus]